MSNVVDVDVTYVPTALSRFRSQRSLIVQPAPRMMSAPVPNRSVYLSGTDGGALSAYEAIVIDQAVCLFCGVRDRDVSVTWTTQVGPGTEETYRKGRITKGTRWVYLCE